MYKGEKKKDKVLSRIVTHVCRETKIKKMSSMLKLINVYKMRQASS